MKSTRTERPLPGCFRDPAESDYVKGFIRDVWPKLCAIYDEAAMLAPKGTKLTMGVSPYNPAQPLTFHYERPKRPRKAKGSR